MGNSYNVMEMDNYVILNTLSNFHLREIYIFVYHTGLCSNMPNLISSKYLGPILFRLQYILILI